MLLELKTLRRMERWLMVLGLWQNKAHQSLRRLILRWKRVELLHTDFHGTRHKIASVESKDFPGR